MVTLEVLRAGQGYKVTWDRTVSKGFLKEVGLRLTQNNGKGFILNKCGDLKSIPRSDTM